VVVINKEFGGEVPIAALLDALAEPELNQEWKNHRFVKADYVKDGLLPLLGGEAVGVRSQEQASLERQLFSKLNKHMVQLGKNNPMPSSLGSKTCKYEPIAGTVVSRNTPPPSGMAKGAVMATIQTKEKNAQEKETATGYPHYCVYIDSQLGADPIRVVASYNVDCKERLLVKSLLRLSCWREQESGALVQVWCGCVVWLWLWCCVVAVVWLC
jgi:hypothetical protein